MKREKSLKELMCRVKSIDDRNKFLEKVANERTDAYSELLKYTIKQNKRINRMTKTIIKLRKKINKEVKTK
tara:strand:+ start:616 stop:828 length:213 start_codon:yes stop_codon:yes gene_type:complete